MEKETVINFQNNLVGEKREMNIYHHKSKGTHLISHGSSISISLQSVREEDYIYLSIVAGPGNLERRNIVDLPAWMNYEFLSEGRFAAVHIEDRVLLKIPVGHPEWKLKLTRQASHPDPGVDRVTISDEQES